MTKKINLFILKKKEQKEEKKEKKCVFFHPLTNWTKWRSWLVEGLLSTGPTPSSLNVDNI